MPSQYDPNDINSVLSRLLKSQDDLTDMLERYIEESRGRDFDKEKRIRVLENWRFYVIGISTGLGLVADKLVEWVFHK